VLHAPAGFFVRASAAVFAAFLEKLFFLHHSRAIGCTLAQFMLIREAWLPQNLLHSPDSAPFLCFFSARAHYRKRREKYLLSLEKEITKLASNVLGDFHISI
jgi:hypothetical protein